MTRLRTTFSRQSERPKVFVSTTRFSGPTPRPNRREGPLGQVELGQQKTVYKRRRRDNDEGIRKLLHLLSARSRVSYLIISPTCTVRRTSFRRTNSDHSFSPFVISCQLLDLIKRVFVLTHRRKLVYFSLLVYRQFPFKQR